LGTLRFVHLGGLSSIAVSPDGKVVASGVTEGKEVYLGEKILHQKEGFTLGTGERLTLATIRLWDADKGALIREVATPDAPVSCLHFAPDGRSLYAGCGRFLCAWDAGTGKQLWQKEGVPGGRFHYGVRAERLLLAKDKLISLHGGTLLCPVSHQGGFSCFYHPQVVVRLWDQGTGKSLPTPEALQSTVHADGPIATLFHDVAVSADGRFAAVLASRADPLPRTEGRGISEDSWKYTARRMLLVDLATGKVSHRVPGDKDVVNTPRTSVWDKVVADTLAFTADGSTLAVATGGKIVLVQTGSGRESLLVKGLPEGKTRLAFVGSKQLMAELGDGKVRAWDVATDKDVDPEPAHTHAFLRAHNGRLAAATHSNTVRLTDLRSGKAAHTFEGHRRTPLVRFALHFRDILLSSDGERACLWETGSWKQEVLAIPKGLSSDRFFFNLESLDEGFSWEKGLYVQERDKRLELWDIKTGRLIRPLTEAGEEAHSLIFSASGDRLVVRTPGSFRFIDVGTGKVLSQLPRSNVIWLCPNRPEMSPCGTYFAQNIKGDRVELYEISSGKLLRTLAPKSNHEAKGSSVLRFHFSPDEKILIGEVHQQITFESGFSEEKVSVTLWDVKSGEIIQEMVVDPKTFAFWRQALSEPKVGTMTLSHDRRLVALARTGGKEIEIWETASGTRRSVLAGHDGPVVSLSFSADGKYLASGSEDTTVIVWDLRRPLQPTVPKDRLETEEVAEHWKMLARPEAKEADLAIWYLAWAAKDAVPFLKERLRPVASPEAGRWKKLLADLDSNEFETRSMATVEIESLGDQVIGELQKAVQGKNDLDKQRRLESLLRAAQDAARPFGTAEKLRQWRALEILEKASTPEAVGLLKDLAGGVPGAWLTEEARAALVRLGPRAMMDR